jgi:hypothetical protein
MLKYTINVMEEEDVDNVANIYGCAFYIQLKIWKRMLENMV